MRSDPPSTPLSSQLQSFMDEFNVVLRAFCFLGVLTFGCTKGNINTESSKVKTQMEALAYLAPTKWAIEQRIVNAFIATGNWPQNNTDFFRSGTLNVDYVQNGNSRRVDWSSNDLRIRLLKMEAGLPVYEASFADVVTEVGTSKDTIAELRRRRKQ
jgi:hypothetical protein